MRLSDIEQTLYDAISDMEIIDAHEHLLPETERLELMADGLFTLFGMYTFMDLYGAGMSKSDYESLRDPQIPLDARWKTFAPYWERIRHTSFSRAILLAVEKFYGFDDINEHNYAQISEAVRKNYSPGLYERVLRDACKIRTCLTQCLKTEVGTDLLTPLMSVPGWLCELTTWESIERPSFQEDACVSSFDDLLEAVEKYVCRVKAEGAVGLKMIALPYGEPNRAEAISIFETVKAGTYEIPGAEPPEFQQPNPLLDYIVDWTIRIAGEQDLTVAVHAGFWRDFRRLDPLHIIPFLQRHPNVRFDVYHLGYPWVRETLMLGKGFSNVWLNFCWIHIISQRAAMDALDEAIDLVPTNKILGFGGDYQVPIEKIYGHLVMARENIARVLAARIERGRMTEDQAIAIAHQWLWDNPKDLYRLDIS